MRRHLKNAARVRDVAAGNNPDDLGRNYFDVVVVVVVITGVVIAVIVAKVVVSKVTYIVYEF